MPARTTASAANRTSRWALTTITCLLALACSACADTASVPAGAAASASSPASADPPSASASPSAAASTSPSASEGGEAARVRERLTTFYRAYLTAVRTEGGPPLEPLTKPYLTPELQKAVYAPDVDTDLLICAQDLPSGVKVGSPVLGPSTAVVKVATIWQGAPVVPLTVTVRLSDLRISRIDCPG
jgi:hypothetical protein